MPYAVALTIGLVLIQSGRTFADAVYIPSAYDHPFDGRMIIEQEALSDVLADNRCQQSWDAGRGHPARA